MGESSVIRVPTSTPVHTWFGRVIGDATIRIGNAIERHGTAVLFLVVAVYVVELLAWAVSTVLTTDELLAYHTASLPSLSALFEASKETPLTADAVVYPFLSFVLLRTVVPHELAMRLPSIAGYAVMMISVFAFVRRRTHTAAALVSVGAALTIPIAAYAVQARPYGLLLGWTGFALLCWQRAAEQPRQRMWLFGLSIALAGALASHYYAALIFIPIIAGEVSRQYINRRIDVLMLLALTCPLTLIVTYIPFLAGVSVYRAHPWHGIVFHDLSQTYLMLSSAGLLLVIAAAGAIAAWPKTASISPPARAFQLCLPVHEILCLCGLLLLPFLGFALGVVVTKTYVFRYCIEFAVGFVILFGAAIAAATEQRPGATALLALFLAGYSQASLLPRVWKFGQNHEAHALKSIPIAPFETYRALPVAVSNFDLFLTLKMYGPDSLKERLTLVGDRDRMLAATGTDNPWIAMTYLERLAGFPLARYEEFCKANPKFLLYGEYWMREELLRNGAQIELILTESPYPLYAVTVRRP